MNNTLARFEKNASVCVGAHKKTKNKPFYIYTKIKESKDQKGYFGMFLCYTESIKILCDM